MDYTGIPCPVCEKPFADGDDIVVCPKCGAPYHRACYDEAGHCIFTDKHELGEVWKPPANSPAFSRHTASAEIKDVECPVCGTLNGKSAEFCNGCGAKLGVNAAAAPDDISVSHYTPRNTGSPYSQPGIPPIYGAGFSFDPMGGVSPTEAIEEDVSFGDVSKLVRQGTAYYLPVFKRIQAMNKDRFNFSAFIFSGGWMLYRKQYKRGLIFTLIMTTLFVGYTLSTIYVSAPILGDLMLRVGMDPNAGIMPNSSQWLAMSGILSQDGMLFFNFCTPLLFLLTMLIIGIICGIKANKWYMKHCIKTVRDIKTHESLDGAGYNYEHKGGVNMPLAIALMLGALLLTYLPMFL